MRTGAQVLATAAAGLFTLTACSYGSTSVDDIGVGPGKGWPLAFRDAHNSGSSPVTGSRKLALNWSRPVGGPVAQPVMVGGDGQLFVTTRIPGCNSVSFQMPTGRKRFCNTMGPSAIYGGSAVDGSGNVYIGDDGAVYSFNNLGQPRFRTPAAGTPVSVQFTGDGNVLSVTQSGQIDVLSRQTGDRQVPTFQLLGEPDFLANPSLNRPPDGQGLEDCAVGGPQCPVANVSAVDQKSGRFYATLWKPGEGQAALVALTYNGKDVHVDWDAQMLTGGSATSPALSADGSTVYVGDNTNRLIAVDAATGKTKWVQDLGFPARGGISVADGLLIPAGDEGHLVALRDKGDSAEIAWERKDLELRGRPVQTAGGTGYTVAPIGDKLTLVTFDTHSGATVQSNDLPGAEGTTVGTAVGDKGEVVVTTRIGELFVFKPET
ncbi:outer membrane protein assembly factor BamB family protein [Nocardia sp. CDC160]|uniref:outer membrane protein assembly factor BamB family protein n=1 Tax=Nocardia sp. CDC160 TaxID=3112166 RepID=UPI002DB82136|nr:PQQ-binding-like beta-propeller repeat protein [Nocardia sp. CDC160]MEC3915224.1 PQQ-binding-like beta-propeller repeat protein [Nocardia sp. CDC160]